MCQAGEEGYANGSVNSSQLPAWMTILYSCLVHTREEASASVVMPSTSVPLHTNINHGAAVRQACVLSLSLRSVCIIQSWFGNKNEI